MTSHTQYLRVLRQLLLAGGLVASLACAPLLRASGTQFNFKDAFAMGRGDAFVATADNPSALFYNPAGLTQLEGTQFSTSLYMVAPSSDYSGAGGTASMKDDYIAVPSFYATWKQPGASWALGLGAYAPFGLSTEWPPNSPLRTFALKNKETYRTYNFSAAWQAGPSVSIGGSITYNRATADLNRAIGIFGPTDRFSFSGNGDEVGFGLSVLWQPDTRNSVGVTYTHQTNIKLSGTSSTIPLIASEPASADFAFPETIVAGWSFRPTPEWNLEADINWTNWERLNTVTIVKASGNTPLPFDWKPSYFYELGATRYLPGGWHVSAGLTYNENSTPDATYTPAVPDSNRLIYNLGGGYKNGRFSVDVAWQYGDGGTRHVTGSPPSLIGATADGSYKNSINGFSVSLGLHF